MHDLTKGAKAVDSVPTFTSLAAESSEVKAGDGKGKKPNKRFGAKDSGAKKESVEREEIFCEV